MAPVSKKKKVFALPMPKRPAVAAARTASPALVTFDVREHEAVYALGALIDAQRAAEDARNKTALAGDSVQSAVFAQKARALAGMVSRIAATLSER